MPTPSPRPSLTTDLATRYATQKAGGAYDAKNIIESGVDALFASFQSSQFQIKNGFLTAQKLEVSDFKNDGGDLSIYVKGLNTKKYDSSFPS
jgi:hypothetical protein